MHLAAHGGRPGTTAPPKSTGEIPARDTPWSVGNADAQLWCTRRPGAYGWHISTWATPNASHKTALVVEDVDSDAELRHTLHRWSHLRT